MISIRAVIFIGCHCRWLKKGLRPRGVVSSYGRTAGRKAFHTRPANAKQNEKTFPPFIKFVYAFICQQVVKLETRILLVNARTVGQQDSRTTGQQDTGILTICPFSLPPSHASLVPCRHTCPFTCPGQPIKQPKKGRSDARLELSRDDICVIWT